MTNNRSKKRNSTLSQFTAKQHLKNSIALVFKNDSNIDKIILIPHKEYTKNEQKIWERANEITIDSKNDYKESKIPDYFKQALDELDIDYAEPVQTQSYTIGKE